MYRMEALRESFHLHSIQEMELGVLQTGGREPCVLFQRQPVFLLQLLGSSLEQLPITEPEIINKSVKKEKLIMQNSHFLEIEFHSLWVDDTGDFPVIRSLCGSIELSQSCQVTWWTMMICLDLILLFFLFRTTV